MSKLTWTPTALDDLQRIAEFIREVRPHQEQAIIGLLITKSEQLEAFPRSGQDKEVRADGTEIRTLRAGKYHRLRCAVTLANQISILQVFDLRSDHEH